MGLGHGEPTLPPRIHVRAPDDIPDALRVLGIGVGSPVLISVGGAGGVAPAHLAVVLSAFNQLVPALDQWGAVVIDGGTDAGVMHVTGKVRASVGASFPLIGVAAEGTVSLPGRAPTPGTARLEPRHSHVILVPGDAWGDESVWLSRIATAIADGKPSLTLVSNGGQVTYNDIEHSLEAGRPVIVLAGTGRAADAIAAAIAGHGKPGGDRTARIAQSPGVTVVNVDDTGALLSAFRSVLASRD